MANQMNLFGQNPGPVKGGYVMKTYTNPSVVPPITAYLMAEGVPEGALGIRLVPGCIMLFCTVYPGDIYGSSIDAMKGDTPWDVLCYLLEDIDITVTGSSMPGVDMYVCGGNAPRFDASLKLHERSNQDVSEIPYLGLGFQDAKEFVERYYRTHTWLKESKPQPASETIWLLRLVDGSWYSGISPTGRVQSTDNYLDAVFFPDSEQEEAIKLMKRNPNSTMYYSTITPPKRISGM